MRKTLFRTLAILLIALLSISVVNAGVDTSPSGPDANIMQRVSNLETLVTQQDEKIKELQDTVVTQNGQISDLQSQINNLVAVHIPTIEGDIDDLNIAMKHHDELYTQLNTKLDSLISATSSVWMGMRDVIFFGNQEAQNIINEFLAKLDAL